MGMRWTEVITFQENRAFYSSKYKTIKVQKSLWFLDDRDMKFIFA